MSRPRKPFGNDYPGRLPATMMKVLAAEMSDPRRLQRGKQYARSGAVLDIIVEPGVVTCEVQGSRSTAYIASIEVSQGDGMPLRRNVVTHCTCPDDQNWEGHTCKHVIAAMFTLSDELLIEPELLDLWRNHQRSDLGHDDAANQPEDNGDTDDGSTESITAEDERRTAPAALEDPLKLLLAVPDGATLPIIPIVDRADPLAPKQRELAGVLRDALANLRIDWD